MQGSRMCSVLRTSKRSQFALQAGLERTNDEITVMGPCCSFYFIFLCNCECSARMRIFCCRHPDYSDASGCWCTVYRRYGVGEDAPVEQWNAHRGRKTWPHGTRL